MNFANALIKENNKTTTLNGGEALKSTGSYLVDLFSTIGSMRESSEQEIIRKFELAYFEDSFLATKILFYARNVRGGLGERRVFRVLLNHLAKNHSDAVKINIENIAHYGRYDDLISLIGTPLTEKVVNLVKETLNKDIERWHNGENVTLLAKWMPSINTSSKETVRNAKVLSKYLGMNEKEYRKTLSTLREYIDVCEKKMSQNEWDKIKYESVPSKSMIGHRKAFSKHDEKGFSEYMTAVKNGEKKINANCIYPYEIVEKYLYGGVSDNVLNEQWKALPNYVDGESDYLVMADVSGSMNGRPMASSIGLAMYFAERNKGIFKNMFMTFSSNPSIQVIKGNTIFEKIKFLERAEWQQNTNLELALMQILKVAVDNEAKQEEIPKSLIVITDMQFDECVSGGNLYNTINDEYLKHNYEMPNIVFWNVSQLKDAYQVHFKISNVQLFSGQSVSTFKQVIKGYGLNPYEAMLQTLNDEMYNRVK